MIALVSYLWAGESKQKARVMEFGNGIKKAIKQCLDIYKPIRKFEILIYIINTLVYFSFFVSCYLYF